MVAALIVAAAAGVSSGDARADLCVVVNPVVTIGCGHADAAPEATRRSADAPSGSDAVALSATAVEHDPERIAVTVVPHATARQAAAAFAAAGVEVEQTIRPIDAYLVRTTPERQAAAVRRLNASPIVARAGPDVVAHALDTVPNDTDWPQQAGLRLIGLPRAWDTSRGSADLVVAVVDTGVDTAPVDLHDALVPGANLVDAGAPPRDDHGHGTAVAGIIAARSNNGQGMAGVCWFCLVMPVKVLDASGSGPDTRIAAGIVWAVDHGARVLNLSLGGPGASPELTAALAYAAGKGAVVIGAAGNSGTTVPFFPAADANVLSVAATTTADRPYSWSNYGSWVNVAAPGCNVAPTLGVGYKLFCGTSSATPIVTGLAALAVSAQPAASSAEIKRAIESAVVPLPGFVQFGRVDAPRALAALGALVPRVSEAQHGTLTRARPVATHDVRSARGTFVATVVFRGGARLALELRSSQTGALLVRRSGRSPLRLSQTVPGAVTVAVRAAAGYPVRFRLRLSYAGA